MKFVKPDVKDIVIFLLPIGIILSMMLTILIPIGMNMALKQNRPKYVLHHFDTNWCLMICSPVLSFISVIVWNSMLHLSLPIGNIMLLHAVITGFFCSWMTYIGEQAVYAAAEVE